MKKKRWLAQELCRFLSILKEIEGGRVCGMRPSGAPRPSLNRPTFNMEKRKGAVKMCDLGRRIMEDEACRVVGKMEKWK